MYAIYTSYICVLYIPPVCVYVLYMYAIYTSYTHTHIFVYGTAYVYIAYVYIVYLRLTLILPGLPFAGCRQCTVLFPQCCPQSKNLQYICIYMYVYVYAYEYVRMCVCVYVYTYILAFCSSSAALRATTCQSMHITSQMYREHAYSVTFVRISRGLDSSIGG